MPSNNAVFHRLDGDIISESTVLVAGIGNIFFGDDAFGVAVAQRLERRPARPGLCVRDYGIRGWDLAFALLDPWRAVIFVDAVQRGEKPGTLFLLDISTTANDPALTDGVQLETHNLDPAKVLTMARSLGAPDQRIYLVGCEPDSNPEACMRMEMGRAVLASLDEACGMVESLAFRLLDEPSRLCAAQL